MKNRFLGLTAAAMTALSPTAMARTPQFGFYLDTEYSQGEPSCANTYSMYEAYVIPKTQLFKELVRFFRTNTKSEYLPPTDFQLDDFEQAITARRTACIEYGIRQNNSLDPDFTPDLDLSGELPDPSK